MSNILDPIDAPAAASALDPQRTRFALRVVPGGFVGGMLGRHSFLFVVDLDSARHWESPGAIREWLEELPAGHANRLDGRSLFVVQSRVAAERIVAAWRLTVPVAEPGAGASRP